LKSRRRHGSEVRFALEFGREPPLGRRRVSDDVVMLACLAAGSESNPKARLPPDEIQLVDAQARESRGDSVLYYRQRIVIGLPISRILARDTAITEQGLSDFISKITQRFGLRNAISHCPTFPARCMPGCDVGASTYPLFGGIALRNVRLQNVATLCFYQPNVSDIS
jgi:hypothetical protein